MSSNPLFYDRVLETSVTTGTGAYALDGTIAGFQTFSVLGDGNSCYYCAADVDSNGTPLGGWEIGIGTYTLSGTTLSRDSIEASSNAGSAVTWAAGTRRVFMVVSAAAITDALAPVDLATAQVTGRLPFAHIDQIASARLLGRSTAGTGNIEVLTSLPDAAQDLITRLGTVTSGRFSNSALRVRDTGGDHDLVIQPNENLTADRTLALILSDAARTLNLGSVTTGTVSIAANSGGFALGNGTSVYYLREIGRLKILKVVFTVGSTTNPGSNFWIFTMPITLDDIYETGVCVARNTAGTRYLGGIITLSTTTFAMGSLAATALAGAGAWQSVYPFNPPAAGDVYAATLVGISAT